MLTDRAFWKFIVVGVMNTINYYILYLLFSSVLHFNYLEAHFLSFFISIIGSFFMNSYFTYKTKPTLKKFLQFPLTSIVNIAISTATIYLSVQFFHLPDTVAPIIASVFPIPFTFLVTRMVLAKP
ncbi:GtrA family protein [Pradoshia sp.]